MHKSAKEVRGLWAQLSAAWHFAGWTEADLRDRKGRK